MAASPARAMTVEERVREIAERVAASHGLEVVEVQLHGGGKARMLRITIDRYPDSSAAPVREAEATSGSGESPQPPAAVTGVTHSDCEHVSREVSTILDVEDVVPGASYTLEVSSPGLDRRLYRPRDYERFTGSRVKVVTRDPVQGQKSFEGRLQSFQDGRLTLSVEPPQSKKKQKVAPAHGEIHIDLSNVDYANLVPEFKF